MGRKRVVFRAKALRVRYWKPRCDYLHAIVDALKGVVRDGDIVAVSEKAISTATGNLVDEANVKPGLTARFLAWFWTRLVWGYILGFLCHMKPETIRRLRGYPVLEGARHKQVALEHAGLLSALNWGSEGGIDGSNLPYSLVSLPLRNPRAVAEGIKNAIRRRLGKRVAVIIIDTDKTYSLKCVHFTPRPTHVDGIIGGMGIIAYLVGRGLRLKARATPVAVAGARISAEDALRIADLANRAMGHGAGRNVWEMAERFNAPISGVTWEMLETVEHKPVAIVRARRIVDRPKRISPPPQPRGTSQ